MCHRRQTLRFWLTCYRLHSCEDITEGTLCLATFESIFSSLGTKCTSLLLHSCQPKAGVILAFMSLSSKKTELAHDKLLLNKVPSYLYHLAKMISISQGCLQICTNIHNQCFQKTVKFYSYTFFKIVEKNT